MGGDNLFLAWVDIAFLAFLTVSVLIGVLRGFVFELLSLAGWFAAYFAARWVAPAAQPYLHIGEPGSALNYGATFASVFLVTLVVWSLAARLLRALIRATPLSPFDRLLGAAFGLLRGVVVLLLVAFVVGVSPWSRASAWQQSHSAVWLNALLDELRPVFVNEVPQHPSA
jgi:membrane protein required for colicin V production